MKKSQQIRRKREREKNSNIIDVTLKKAISLLIACKAKFKIITTEGEEFGELDMSLHKQQRQQRDLWKYYQPFFTDVKPYDVVLVPFEQHDPRRLVGAISAYCSKIWGNGAHTIFRNKNKNCVEVLRIK